MGEPARISDVTHERDDSYERETALGETAVDGTAVDGTAVDGTAVDGTAVDGTAVDGTAVDQAGLEADDDVDACESLPESEPMVELGFSELFDSDIIAEDEDGAGPWCVDTGNGIECLSTLGIWMSLAAGTIAPDTKVWRDGRACWMPVSEVDELTRATDDEILARELEESHPEISQVIVKRAANDAAPRRKRRWRPNWTRWHSLGLVLGIAVGGVTAAIIGHVRRPEPAAEAGRVAIDIADRAHLLGERTMQRWRDPEPGRDDAAN